MARIGTPEKYLVAIQTLPFEIADLEGDRLAQATPNAILIDVDAAGYGWFFDSTPLEDSEFSLRVPRREFQADEFSSAHRHVDLLTVLVREMGRVYVDGRDRTPKRLRPLMDMYLSPGVRRVPLDRDGALPVTATNESAAKADTGAVDVTTANRPDGADASNPVFADVPSSSKLDDDRSGETITKNIGTVPAGKTLTVTFRVSIDTPFPVGDCSVDNQGTVSGSNFANVLTDDPSVAGAANPTSTTIPSPPIIGACPANMSVNNTPGTCGAVVTFTPPTATGCPLPTVTCVPASGSTFVDRDDDGDVHGGEHGAAERDVFVHGDGRSTTRRRR